MGDDIVRDWNERLDRADELFAQGNLSRAAALAGAVDEEVSDPRKRPPQGSPLRNEHRRVRDRARALLDRIENAAGASDEDEDE